MAWLAVVSLGAVSLHRLPIDLLPDLAFPALTVWTTYRDAGPLEVEELVTEPVEAELSRVPGVRKVASRSRQGQSLIELRFDWGTDMEFAALHVRERLDDLRGALPRDARRPVILRSDPGGGPAMVLALVGGDPRVLRPVAEGVVKRRLEQLDGVALAAVTGGPEREILVEPGPERLAVHGLQPADLAAALDAANHDAPGGRIRRGRFELGLRTLGRFTAVGELGDVVVARPADAAPVLLKDVAAVRDTVAEHETVVRHDGVPALGLGVYEEAGANTVRVADRVAEALAGLARELPGVRIRVAASQARFVRDAIANVTQALLVGGLLAFAVLFLFLRDPRYPLAVGLAIPVSVAAAFGLLHLFGVGLNVMSLGGLALGAGLLVDNSIVVLESIFRHREEHGRDPRAAAAAGAREVTPALTASTLTTIAVFAPVVYVDGVAGALFADLSLAVAFSLLASLLAALTLLPPLAARLGAGRGPVGGTAGGPASGALAPGDMAAGVPAAGAAAAVARPGSRLLARFDRAFERLGAGYEAALGWSLAHRAAVLGTAAAGLALAIPLGSGLPRSLVPRVDEGLFRVRLELPPGTPLEETGEAARRLEAVAMAEAGVEGVFTRVGRASGPELAGFDLAGSNTAALEVRLAPGTATARTVERFRAGLGGTGLDPRSVAVETGRATSLGRALEPGEADLAVEVRGGELEALLPVAESAAARLAGLPVLADVRLGDRQAQPELEVEVDRAAAARHGLAVREVTEALETLLRGTVTARPYVEFADRVTIRIRPPQAARSALADVLDLPVRGVPLRELVRARRGQGPVEVRREDGARTVRVLAEVTRGGLGQAVERVETALEGLDPPTPTTLRVAGETEAMRASFGSLRFAFGLALLLVYLILAAQFESLLRPAVVLASVPLAAVGAVLGLWIAGAGLNAMSGIGLVILVGIAVNDAILEVDSIDRLRATGRGKREAVLEAGRLRLRPILMTTVTTVAGLLPLALGWGAGADLRAPLAVAVIGGLLSATFLTLIVVPVAYSVLVS